MVAAGSDEDPKVGRGACRYRLSALDVLLAAMLRMRGQRYPFANAIFDHRYQHDLPIGCLMSLPKSDMQHELTPGAIRSSDGGSVNGRHGLPGSSNCGRTNGFGGKAVQTSEEAVGQVVIILKQLCFCSATLVLYR